MISEVGMKNVLYGLYVMKIYLFSSSANGEGTDNKILVLKFQNTLTVIYKKLSSYNFGRKKMFLKTAVLNIFY